MEENMKRIKGKTIGARIQTTRHRRNFTIKELERHTGIDADAISDYECNRAAPPIADVVKIANALNVSPPALAGYEEGYVEIVTRDVGHTKKADFTNLPKRDKAIVQSLLQVMEEDGCTAREALDILECTREAVLMVSLVSSDWLKSERDTEEGWIADVIGRMHIHKITQTMLAEKIGLRRDYVSKILNGQLNPRGARERIEAGLDELCRGA